MVDGIAVAALLDLATMKLAALSRRGLRRDFWDLAEIVRRKGNPLQQACQAYRQRYGVAEADLYHVLRSLTWFEDAERDPAFPAGLTEPTWREIEAFFLREAPGLMSTDLGQVSRSSPSSRRIRSRSIGDGLPGCAAWCRSNVAERLGESPGAKRGHGRARHSGNRPATDPPSAGNGGAESGSSRPSERSGTIRPRTFVKTSTLRFSGVDDPVPGDTHEPVGFELTASVDPLGRRRDDLRDPVGNELDDRFVRPRPAARRPAPAGEVGDETREGELGTDLRLDDEDPVGSGAVLAGSPGTALENRGEAHSRPAMPEPRPRREEPDATHDLDVRPFRLRLEEALERDEVREEIGNGRHCLQPSPRRHPGSIAPAGPLRPRSACPGRRNQATCGRGTPRCGVPSASSFGRRPARRYERGLLP